MLRIAVVVLVVMHIFAGIVALLSFVAPKMMISSTFEAITGKEIDSVQDADLLEVMLNRQSKVGFYALSTVVFCLFVLLYGFRQAKKWAWWCLLVVAGIVWAEGLISYIIMGNVMYIIIYAIGMALLFLGVLLPIKAFFGTEVQEA